MGISRSAAFLALAAITQLASAKVYLEERFSDGAGHTDLSLHNTLLHTFTDHLHDPACLHCAAPCRYRDCSDLLMAWHTCPKMLRSSSWLYF